MKQCITARAALAGPNGAGKTTFAREYLPRTGTLIVISENGVVKHVSPEGYSLVQGTGEPMQEYKAQE